MNSIEMIDYLIDQVKSWQHPLSNQDDVLVQFRFEAKTILSKYIRSDNPHVAKLLTISFESPINPLAVAGILDPEKVRGLIDQAWKKGVDETIYHLEAIKKELVFLNNIDTAQNKSSSNQINIQGNVLGSTIIIGNDNEVNDSQNK